MADRILCLASRVSMRLEVVVTGGVDKNSAIMKQLGAKLGLAVRLPSEPQILCALGAALFALDQL